MAKPTPPRRTRRLARSAVACPVAPHDLRSAPIPLSGREIAVDDTEPPNLPHTLIRPLQSLLEPFDRILVMFGNVEAQERQLDRRRLRAKEREALAQERIAAQLEAKAGQMTAPRCIARIRPVRKRSATAEEAALTSTPPAPPPLPLPRPRGATVIAPDSTIAAEVLKAYGHVLPMALADAAELDMQHTLWRTAAAWLDIAANRDRMWRRRPDVEVGIDQLRTRLYTAFKRELGLPAEPKSLRRP